MDDDRYCKIDDEHHTEDDDLGNEKRYSRRLWLMLYSFCRQRLSRHPSYIYLIILGSILAVHKEQAVRVVG